MPKKAKMCLLRGLGDGRHIHAAADHASDVSKRNAFVADAVIADSCRTILQHEPVQTSRIEPVHRGPAVEPLTYVSRCSLLTRDADECRNEAVIAVAMHRGRKPND